MRFDGAVESTYIRIEAQKNYDQVGVLAQPLFGGSETFLSTYMVVSENGR